MYLALTSIAVIMLAPLAWLVVTSFKSPEVFFSHSFPSLQHYMHSFLAQVLYYKGQA